MREALLSQIREILTDPGSPLKAARSSSEFILNEVWLKCTVYAMRSTIFHGIFQCKENSPYIRSLSLDYFYVALLLFKP